MSLRNADACARLCRVSIAIRFDLLLLSAAALPVLWQCGLITVYRCTHQCGERSNAAFGRQSAAVLPSLAPHDSKARLQDVTICKRFMAKPCTPHPHCAACAVIRATNCQCRGTRGLSPRPRTLAVSILKSCSACGIGCGVHGFAMNPCESLPLSTAPYYREARVTFAWRQTACRMRHCCARRIVETGSRRELLRTSTR